MCTCNPSLAPLLDLTRVDWSDCNRATTLEKVHWSNGQASASSLSIFQIGTSSFHCSGVKSSLGISSCRKKFSCGFCQFSGPRKWITLRDFKPAAFDPDFDGDWSNVLELPLLRLWKASGNLGIIWTSSRHLVEGPQLTDWQSLPFHPQATPRPAPYSIPGALLLVPPEAKHQLGLEALNLDRNLTNLVPVRNRKQHHMQC